MPLLNGLGNWFKEQLQHVAVNSASPQLAENSVNPQLVARQVSVTNQMPQSSESPNIQGSMNYGITVNPQAVRGSYFYNAQPQSDPTMLNQGITQWSIPSLVHAYDWNRGPQLIPHMPQYIPIDAQPVSRIR